MKCCIITNKGLEEYSSKEIKEILNCETEIKERLVFFETTKENLVKLAYYGRTFQRAILILEEYEFKDNPLEQFKAEIIEDVKESFTVDGERYGESAINSFEMRKKLGFFINQKTKKKYDIKNGLTKFYFFIENNYFIFGLDISGFDLSKRDYRIFLSPEEIKPTVAASMLLEAEYSKEKIILDPFCRSGTISIEAAMIALNKSPNHYSKEKFSEKINFKEELKDEKTEINCIDRDFKHVNAAKKNAKIAGVNKYINFSRQETDDLDLKFDKESLDIIATQTPKFSKKKDIEDLKQTYKTFFKQAELLLKKKGKLVILANNEIIKEFTKLKLVKEKKVIQGEQESWILSFEK